MASAMAAGVRFVGMSPALQQIYLRGGLFGFGASAVWSLLPVVAHTRLDAGPMTFGLLMGSLGAGSLCGAIVAAWIRSLVGNNTMVTLSTVGFGLAALGLAFSSSPVFSAMLAFAAGVSWIFVFTTTRTCVQLSSPRWVVGRTVSLGQVASFGSMSVGAALWGALASRFGVAEALVASGVFLMLSTLAALMARLPTVDPVDAAPPQRPDMPPPRVTLSGRIGPVVVTIEYHVPTVRNSEFLELMSELGRVRRRNGATAWTIQQDIDDPESWTERIHSPTWTDHLRRLDRYTADDRQLIVRAEAFRTTERRPVRRMVERPRGSLPLC
jgi:MFS family permease